MVPRDPRWHQSAGVRVPLPLGGRRPRLHGASQCAALCWWAHNLWQPSHVACCCPKVSPRDPGPLEALEARISEAQDALGSAQGQQRGAAHHARVRAACERTHHWWIHGGETQVLLYKNKRRKVVASLSSLTFFEAPIFIILRRF